MWVQCGFVIRRDPGRDLLWQICSRGVRGVAMYKLGDTIGQARLRSVPALRQGRCGKRCKQDRT